MEKKKPTIDEIYKLNVDGLFESTANWFDNAFKKSQAEINRDLYNKINGYSSSSESTGGNVSLGPLLTSLNSSNLYPSRGYLYYNGDSWEFNTPTISGGEGGGVVDTAAITKIVNDTIKNVSWWGQKINNNKVDGNIVITKGSHSFTIELDDNGNLKFNGNIYATGGITALGVGTTTGGGSGVSLGTLLAQLNNENPFPTSNGQVLTYDGSNFVWKTPTGSGGGSIQVAQTPEYSGESESWVSATKLRFIGITGTKPTITTNSNKGCVDVGIPTGGESGSSSRIKYIKLFTNNSDYPFETIGLGTADTIGFMQGDNITFQAVVKDFTNVIKISATGSSGGSSTGGSVDLSSYLTKTEASTTYAAKSHTHSASNITDFTSTVKGITVDNAKNADKANELNSAVTLWGNYFYGSNNINGNIKMSSTGGGSIQLWMNNGNMLDRINNILHIGYGLKESSDGEINLDAYATRVFTDNMSKHYDFKSNVFDVNSNQIHFGSETNGGKISWDAANNAFKIEGNVYATGGITALGVSNNATTSNNVDFTFRSVTANTFNVMDSIQLSYGLKLERNAGDFDLVSTDGNVNSFYFDGNNENYYLNTRGEAFFSNLDCEYLSFSGVSNFKIVNAGSTTFTIQFEYNSKTYQFTPSEGSVTVS